MKLWIYDEDNWPSGYAGGRVLDQAPELIAQNITVERHYVEGPTVLSLPIENPSEVQVVATAQIDSAVRKPKKPLEFQPADDSIDISWADTKYHIHTYTDEASHVLDVVDGSSHGTLLQDVGVLW